MDGERHCALPGCDEVVTSLPGRPERRFCCPGHRESARQARRDANRLARAAVDSVPGGSVPGGSVPVGSVPVPVGVDPGPVADPAPVAVIGPAAAAASMEVPSPGVSSPEAVSPRVASPAAASPIAASPAAASAGIAPPEVTTAGGASAQVVGRSFVVARTAPRPARVRPPVATPTPAPAPRRTRRHRRAIAVLGAAGALVAGYCITASGPDVAATHPSVLAVPELADERGWAEQAEVVLASVDDQLGDVADAEAEWHALPDQVRERRTATFVALLRRKAYLETQKTLLQTQLGTYRSLARAGDELRQAQQQLAYIERELTIATDPARRTPAQSALVTALEENRRTLERRRDAKQDEMRGLSSDVRTAARVPLLDDPAATRKATAEVRRIVADPTAPVPHDATDDRRPEAVPGRPAQRDGMPSVEVGTGAPPDPGSGPVDLERLASGGDAPVLPVVHVEAVPDPVPDAPDTRRREEPADPPPAEPAAPTTVEPAALVAPPDTDAPPTAVAPPAPGPVQATAPGTASTRAPAASATPSTSASTGRGPAAGTANMIAPSVGWMYPGMAETVRAAEAEQARRAGAAQAPPAPAEPAATGADDPDRVVG